MRFFLSLMIGLFFSTIGCGPQRVTLSKGPTSPEFFQFKQFAFDHELKILTKDSLIMNASSVDITFENITWYDKKAKETKSIPLTSVKRINVVNRSEGAFWGMATGMVSGFGTGLTLAWQDGSTSYVPLSGFWEYISGPILGAGAGAITGSGVGFLIGVRRTYEFAE